MVLFLPFVLLILNKTSCSFNMQHEKTHKSTWFAKRLESQPIATNINPTMHIDKYLNQQSGLLGFNFKFTTMLFISETFNPSDAVCSIYLLSNRDSYVVRLSLVILVFKDTFSLLKCMLANIIIIYIVTPLNQIP